MILNCRNCTSSSEYPDAMAGRSANCAVCGYRFNLPKVHKHSPDPFRQPANIPSKRERTIVCNPPENLEQTSSNDFLNAQNASEVSIENETPQRTLVQDIVCPVVTVADVPSGTHSTSESTHSKLSYLKLYLEIAAALVAIVIALIGYFFGK
ncbi:MAG: hypothetical protein R3B84_10810 [Zavarzinella sp.]